MRVIDFIGQKLFANDISVTFNRFPFIKYLFTTKLLVNAKLLILCKLLAFGKLLVDTYFFSVGEK